MQPSFSFIPNNQAAGLWALCLHWFNSLVWLAFIQAGKDMEMSCDEAVIKRLGPGIRADYSAALLRLATGHRIIASTPLAFGEGDTKGRVRNMAKWKKPKLWVSILGTLLCIAVLTACALNPTAKDALPELPFTLDHLPEGYTYEVGQDQSYAFTDGTNTIGGIVRYAVPENAGSPHADFVWLSDAGIPDLNGENLTQSANTSAYGDWDIRVESDVPPGMERTVDRYHTFFVVEDYVYDVWFDMMQVNQTNTVIL